MSGCLALAAEESVWIQEGVNDILEYLLNGLEAELELDRELGIKTIECDRSLLVSAAPAVTVAKAVTPPPVNSSVAAKALDIVFVHHCPLAPDEIKMMSAIILKLGYTAETAPIVIEKPIPQAKVFVFLGARALKKFLPDMILGENRWGVTAKGKDILLVKSPSEILRFSAVTPAVMKIKQDMWRSLKSIKARLAL